MYKYLLCLSILIRFSVLSAQIDTLTHGISEAHVQITGTKVWMKPPTGFEPSQSFAGFEEKVSSSSIVVLALQQAIPIMQMDQSFTEENLAGQGIKLIDKQALLVNGMKAIWIEGEQRALGVNFTKYVLVLSGSEETLIINGVAPVDSADLAQGVKEAMRRTVYDANIKIDPMEIVDFRLDIQGSKFQYATFVANMLAYSVDGKMPTESEDKANFMAGKSLGKVLVPNPRKYALNRLKKLDEVEPEEVNAIEIDGLKGYEIIAYKADKQELIYQVMLFEDEHYYIMVGLAEADFEENIRAFRRLVQRFQLK
ncbi:MAG: hypothetical protein AAFQ83_22545 [Bacteroidota bacterium]